MTIGELMRLTCSNESPLDLINLFDLTKLDSVWVLQTPIQLQLTQINFFLIGKW